MQGGVMKERKIVIICLGIAIIVLAVVMLIGSQAEGAEPEGIILRPFDGYLEFAEWVSVYQVPELAPDADCDDYAYAMFIDGLNKGYWVSVQLEWQETTGHMFVAGYIKYSNGDIKVRFVDGETRQIFKKMYGYMWRVD
jgi:hypothetical protein